MTFKFAGEVTVYGSDLTEGHYYNLSETQINQVVDLGVRYQLLGIFPLDDTVVYSIIILTEEGFEAIRKNQIVQ